MSAGQLATVVHANPLRTAALGDHRVKRACHAPAWQTRVHLQRQAFAGESVHHGQHSHRAPIRQTIVNEINRPLLIGFPRQKIVLPLAHQALAFPPLDAQTSCPIDAKYTLVIHGLTFSS